MIISNPFYNYVSTAEDCCLIKEAIKLAFRLVEYLEQQHPLQLLIHFYADDTVLYSAGPFPDVVLHALQQSFLSVQQAFSTLNLVLNNSKAKVMITGVIATSQGLELEVVNSYKLLGVWLDGTLSAHIKAAD